MSESWDKTKQVMKWTSPLGWLIMEGSEKAAEAMTGASQGTLQQLKEEAAKQEIQMQFAQHQARVAQELAIARRIDNAMEVEIEEFYDASGKGSLGLDANAATETVTLGIQGEGRRITRRVYRFKGWRNDMVESIEQNMVE
jgi:hypothetical protein